MHRDFVFALRQLRTNLRFSLIIVLTLALGIGATTAIFSVVSGVLLRALPFPESERLISLQTVVFPHGEAATKEAGAGTIEDVSFPDFFDWRGQSHPPSFWGTFWLASASAVNAIGSPQKESVSLAAERTNRAVQVVGRLKPDVSVAQARAEMNAIQRSLAEQYPEDRNAFGVEVRLLLDHVSGDFRQPLYILFGAVTAVLLIACANVAGLLLARGFARRPEFGVRVALGARPSHIMRQVLIESTVLACCAG